MGWFRLFGEKGGLLKALGLWDWYEKLSPQQQKKVKYYFSLKTIKNIRFPHRAKDFDRGEVKTLYTPRTFLGSIAQMALLEGDYPTAEWLYLEALRIEGTPYEAHLILNDLVLLAQKLKDFEKMEKYAQLDVDLFQEYAEELKEKNGGRFPQINSFEVLIYLKERKGDIEGALSLLDRMISLGIPHPFADEVRQRLLSRKRL